MRFNRAADHQMSLYINVNVCTHQSILDIVEVNGCTVPCIAVQVIGQFECSVARSGLHVCTRLLSFVLSSWATDATKERKKAVPLCSVSLVPGSKTKATRPPSAEFLRS